MHFLGTEKPRIYNGEKIVSSIKDIGLNWVVILKRMTLNPYLTPYTKIKSKSINLIEEQNRNHKTSKTKHWSILLVNGFSNEFLSDIRNKDNKWKKIKKLGYMTLKRFYTVKETIKKMKKQPRQWEKIFASHICDKGLVSKIYKKLIQLNTIQ